MTETKKKKELVLLKTAGSAVTPQLITMQTW